MMHSCSSRAGVDATVGVCVQRRRIAVTPTPSTARLGGSHSAGAPNCQALAMQAAIQCVQLGMCRDGRSLPLWHSRRLDPCISLADVCPYSVLIPRIVYHVVHPSLILVRGEWTRESVDLGY